MSQVSEGAKSRPEWRAELARRGVELIEDVCREEALDVYRQFAASGAFVYNGRGGGRR